MNMIEKILNGFTLVIAWLGNLFGRLFTFLGNLFSELFDLLAKPLSYVLSFFDGVFYFITVLFNVAVKCIQIFVALFQFLGSIILGVLRTIRLWLTVSISPNTKFPSASNQGFQTVIDLLMPTGLMTVVPMVAIAFLWFFFIVKIIGLVSGQGSVNVIGSGGSK